MIDWLFISANWSGSVEADCVKDGACWVFIKAWSKQFFYGSFRVSFRVFVGLRAPLKLTVYTLGKRHLH